MLGPAFLQVKIDFLKWCPTIDTRRKLVHFLSVLLRFVVKVLRTDFCCNVIAIWGSSCGMGSTVGREVGWELDLGDPRFPR